MKISQAEREAWESGLVSMAEGGSTRGTGTIFLGGTKPVPGVHLSQIQSNTNQLEVSGSAGQDRGAGTMDRPDEKADSASWNR